MDPPWILRGVMMLDGPPKEGPWARRSTLHGGLCTPHGGSMDPPWCSMGPPWRSTDGPVGGPWSAKESAKESAMMRHGGCWVHGVP